MSGAAERLAARLPEAEIDAMLVTELVNVRYLTGYSGSNGLALVGASTRTFITDFRYLEQAAEEVHASFARVRAPQDLLEEVPEALPGGPKSLRLGFEGAHMSFATHLRLGELLDDRKIELVPTRGLVEELRAVKSPQEIEQIRAASALADEALEALLDEGLVGRTEQELAMALEVRMRQRGAQRPSFETIVASGPHGALPHAQPRPVKIAPGQLVVIDWGAELAGFCSDCTRTVATGPLDEEAQEVYALVLAAQQAGVRAVRAQRSGRDVDAVARELIVNAGRGEQFGHGLGHGVGLQIHEAPRLSQRSQDTLAVGNVVTVEPGVYVPGKLGVRIEDLVVVQERGCDVLTSVPKELRTV